MAEEHESDRKRSAASPLKRLWNHLRRAFFSGEERYHANLIAGLPAPGRYRTPQIMFTGNGPSERQLACYWDRNPWPLIDSDGEIEPMANGLPEVTEVTVEIKKFVLDPLRFAARKMDSHILFFESNVTTLDELQFLPDTRLELFELAYRRRPPGRCVMHTPRCMQQDRCVYLFFDTDGSGFSLTLNCRKDNASGRRAYRYERVDFRWDDLRKEAIDFLAEPVSNLRPLFEALFEERINPSLREPYPYREKMEEIPLSWRSGSEDRLRMLTELICRTEPGLFGSNEPVTVIFRSTTPYKRGGFRRVCRELEHVVSPRLMSLCDLAFRLNECEGLRWIDYSGVPGNIQRSAISLSVSVAPPSAHEKAEAYLQLIGWLDAVLHRREKREQFNLPPRQPDSAAD